jgi:radical SAM-linked protein
VQKLRIRYAKRGRLRFTSHRDIARAFERALRRAAVPIGYSAGFSPHPKVSWMGAAPTGMGSEAEYVEIGVTRALVPAELSVALDAALPPGIDVVAVAVFDTAAGDRPLAEQLDASRWRMELLDLTPDAGRELLESFLAAPEVPVSKLTKSGRKTVDARAAVAEGVAGTGTVEPGSGASVAGNGTEYAILDVVVRHVTPAVRPDDILTGMCAVTNLSPPSSVRMTRLAQGLLTTAGDLVEPLVEPVATDRAR